MSKKSKVFLSCCLALMIACGFVGCQNMNKALEDSVSEIHETVLYGRAEGFFVEVIGGRIENDYALDGVKNGMKNFVAVKVRTDGEYSDMSAAFTVNGKTYNETLTGSPFDAGRWTAVTDGELPVETLDVTLTADGESFGVALAKVPSGDVKPLDILKENFESQLMECYKDGKFDCEISVRLVKSPDENSDVYYWYVVAYKPDKTFFGLMIDSATGEVLAKKS